MPKILDKELHLHLFGCLTAEDLWEIGNKEKPRPDSLGWYVEEFDRVYGRKPNPSLYFTGDRDKDLFHIKRDYECLGKVKFSEFQASFNLAIALNPNRFADAELLDMAVRRQIEQGNTYAEFRIVLPPRLGKVDQLRYLEYINDACIRNQTKTFTAKLILTLFRDSTTLDEDYLLLKNWQHTNSQIIGIDFCMDEQSSPPTSKLGFIERLRRDNTSHPESALELVYHVGESYDRLGLAISSSWISQITEFGVRRLGHALSMGVDPLNSKNIVSQVDSEILRDHLQYTLTRIQDLQRFNFPFTADEVYNLVKNLTSKSYQSWPPREKALEATLAWQNLAIQDVRSSGSVLECCPTSNYILGEMETLKQHPLKQFLAAGIPCVISTDDPGIFAITLEDEEANILQDCGLDEAQLADMNRIASRIAGSPPMLK